MSTAEKTLCAAAIKGLRDEFGPDRNIDRAEAAVLTLLDRLERAERELKEIDRMATGDIIRANAAESALSASREECERMREALAATREAYRSLLTSIRSLPDAPWSVEAVRVLRIGATEAMCALAEKGDGK